MTTSFSEKKIAILGSTGSIGTQAVETLSALGCEIVLLTAGQNVELLAQQLAMIKPKLAAVAREEDLSTIKASADSESIRFFAGPDGICEAIAECGADVIVHAVAGLAGIPYAIAAARTGARLAMANKEVIISAGALLYQELEASGGELIPVDSEHSAIFQCLTTLGSMTPPGRFPTEQIKRILLTASGGPFFGRSKDALAKVTREEALNHPTWKMGGKITVDSATLMNKGFEVMEAVRLFSVPVDRIQVLVHRQSIVHSMVEFQDRAVMAQLGLPDMRTCIRYAVTYPIRADVPAESLDLFSMGQLTFEKPDADTFPLLTMAYEAIRIDGSAPTALIAADEEAVWAFMDGKLSFAGIPDAVRRSMDRIPVRQIRHFEEVFEAEREARAIAREEISRIITKG